MEITVNGQPRQVRDGITLADLLGELQLGARHIAVERNLEVVPRARHGEIRLQPGDRLEVVTLVGGG